MTTGSLYKVVNKKNALLALELRLDVTEQKTSELIRSSVACSICTILGDFVVEIVHHLYIIELDIWLEHGYTSGGPGY